MASAMQPLPYPDYPPVSSTNADSALQGFPASLSSSINPSSSSQQPQAGEFFSTTTAPLRDHEQDAPLPSERRRKVSTNSISSSVLDRPRPKPANRSEEPQARPSSFFGADATTDYDPARPSGEWQAEGATSPSWQTTSAGVEGNGLNGREGGQGEDIEALYDGQAPGEVSAQGRLVRQIVPTASTSTSNQPSEVQQRRSSFYGLDSHTPQQSSRPPTGDSTPSRNDSSPARQTLSSQSSSGVDRTRPQTHNSSGSGSYSSHELPNRPRYSQAPYAASRAASLYGISGSTSNILNHNTPLMDQSHLQPGNMASLLSHDKTLELYRQNAKKTNDVNVQFEFCAFVMEVVTEMEQAAAMDKMAVAENGNGNGADEVRLTEVQQESKRKQKALVTESITLLNKLAQRGHVKSQYFLADCYTQGVGTLKGKRDYDKAFPLFMLAGKHGHADASFRAAQCLEHGWGCRKDQNRAVSLYRRAAVLSHPGSMHRLGLAEINGELGLTKRPKDGVQWLKRAAELADQVDPPQPQSLHELSILHEKGIDNVIFQDEEYAAELLARAAELQYAPSAYKLGECYEYGRMGCPQDAALSIHYYNIAAQQNHPAACFALTAWYLVGSPGILPQSDTEAYLWAKKSAEMGFPKAEYACGYFTESGIGTYQDAREALEWFRKAASHGDKRALDRLRNAGQPIPAQVAPLRHTSSSNALNNNRTPSPSAPTNPRSLSNKLITKNKQPLPPQPRSEQPRSESVGRTPRPISKDVKGKGRESDPGRPGFTRQRSNSQPTPFDARQHYQQQLRQQPSQNDFNPLPYANGAQSATVGGTPRYPRDGGIQQQQQQRNFSPLQPNQVRMPLRQQVNGATTPQEVAGDSGAKQAERERVLRKAKGGAEDKDCTIM